MELTRQQKYEFRQLGYTVLRGAVPQVMIDDALRAINFSLGYEGMNKNDLPRLRTQSYCNEVQKTRVITDLMNRSPVFPSPNRSWAKVTYWKSAQAKSPCFSPLN